MLLARSDTRERLDLSGAWRFHLDPDNCGIARGWHRRGLPSDAMLAPVPGIWNLFEPDYDGVAYYETTFDAAPAWPSRSARIVCGGSNYHTRAWLNGQELGAHEGGYSPFAFDCSLALRAEANVLVLRIVDPPADRSIDGMTRATIPCGKEGWYGGFGGPWGGLWLEVGGRGQIVDVHVQPLVRDRAVRLTIDVTGCRQADGPSTVRVEVTDAEGRGVGRAEGQVRSTEALSTLELVVPIARPRLWSPERPYLYHWRVSFHCDGDVDTLAGRFGMRSLDFQDGSLVLNGRERRIEGVLLQPVYPGTGPAPCVGRSPAEDVASIRAAGFNLVRSHLRPPPPGFLDETDRQGLMVYVETPLAWITPGPRLLEHGQREVAAMVRTARNHPSVVLWGLFNENAEASHQISDQLAADLRRLDSTRPTIDNSGGTAIGEVGMWSWPGTSRVWSPGSAEPTPLNDVHIYVANPLRSDSANLLRGVGRAPAVETVVGVADSPSSTLASGKVFVSELGTGGLPCFDVVVRGFRGQRQLADARRLRAFRDDLRSGLSRRGLDREIGGLAEIVARSQELQARGLADQIAAVRSNPRVSGYIVTQFAEAGWELMACLVDMWGRKRPAYSASRASRSQAFRGHQSLGTPAAVPAVEWTGDHAVLVDAAAVTTDDPASLAEMARQGGHLCLTGLGPDTIPVWTEVLGLPLRLDGARGNFMGMFHYLRDHPMFDGLGAPCLADARHAELLPDWALAEVRGASVLAGCFWMPDGGPGFQWRATVQTVVHGRGRLTLYQLRPLHAARAALCEWLRAN
jgi:hypothetical protein